MNSCSLPCGCTLGDHEPKLVVLTGGPGAGKTAVLEMVRKSFCEHVAVLPEAAGIVYGGGFPRRTTRVAQRAAQRSIYHVQLELERIAVEERTAAVALCDRGTLDGLAYWPGPADELWRDVGSSLAAQLQRYTAVIHLRTPAPDAYNHRNPLRIETAAEAAAIDARILALWSPHPRRVVIDSSASFLDKVAHALAAIRAEVPACCRAHELTLPAA
jgi:predicted ATPase